MLKSGLQDRCAYLLGWNAIPLALDDFDSNFSQVSYCFRTKLGVDRYLGQHVRGGLHLAKRLPEGYRGCGGVASSENLCSGEDFVKSEGRESGQISRSIHEVVDVLS